MKNNSALYIFLGLLSLSSCKKETTSSTPVTYDDSPYQLVIGDLPTPDVAADNPLTIQGVKLGRMLFYEPMLSKDGSMSCATCHRQEDAFSDTNTFSIGVEGLQGKRQAMAVFNMAWNTNEFFWDGRAHLLRDQSLKPIQDPLEMNEALDNVIAKLNASQMYKDQFIRAFGTSEITAERMSLAMEQFMNSIVSVNSKYDQYLRGDLVLTDSEERGRALFFAEYNPFFPDQSGADCAHCHSPPNFENDQYMNNGLYSESEITDLGRQEVTQDPSHKGMMKVPTLRNIELTPPYMHDGSLKTLEEVVTHYNSTIKSSSTLDPTLKNTQGTGLMLTPQDQADLVAFLKTLTDDEFVQKEEFSDPF
jgi:cytochrome c peroxidase